MRVKLLPQVNKDALVLIPLDTPGLPAWFKAGAAYQLRVITLGGLAETAAIVVERAPEDIDVNRS